MAKVELGDIFEIITTKGKGYFQCVKIDQVRGDLIKVYNKVYNDKPLLISDMVSVKDAYYIGFPVNAALNRKLISKIGNIPLPANLELPTHMRDKHIIQGEFLGWFIIEVKTLKRQFVEELTQEQRSLSPIGLYNDTLLKERLERGWNLENW